MWFMILFLVLLYGVGLLSLFKPDLAYKLRFPFVKDGEIPKWYRIWIRIGGVIALLIAVWITLPLLRFL